MNNEFAFISNTIGEFELFVKSKNFYWPRGLMKKTSYQRGDKLVSVKENKGDLIYIITGADIQSKVKDTFLKNKITSSPMLTHQGVVESVFNNLVSYNYTIRKETYSIPLLSIQDLLDLDTYLGQRLGQSDIDELKNVLIIKEILDKMESDHKLEYVRAYSLDRKKDTKLYVEYNGKYFTLEPLLQEYGTLPADLEDQKKNNRAKYYTFPSKESIEELRNELYKMSFSNVDEYLSRLYTWQQGEFVKVAL